MSKQKKFAELSVSDARKKHAELSKELVKFRMTLDPSSITSASSPTALQQDLKLLARKAAAAVAK
jgi:hypothetical protein